MKNIAKISYNNKDLMKRPVEDYGEELFYMNSIMLNNKEQTILNIMTAFVKQQDYL